MDARVLWVRVEERGDRGLQYAPVATGKIGAPDRAGEEHIAREEVAVREEGEVRGRVSRHERDRERDTTGLDRLATVEPDVRRRAPDVDSRRCERGRLLDKNPFA